MARLLIVHRVGLFRFFAVRNCASILLLHRRPLRNVTKDMVKFETYERLRDRIHNKVVGFREWLIDEKDQKQKEKHEKNVQNESKIHVRRRNNAHVFSEFTVVHTVFDKTQWERNKKAI